MNRTIRNALALTALIATPWTAYALPVVYHDEAAFTNALSSYAVDDFSDLPLGEVPTPVPRTITNATTGDTFSYEADAPSNVWMMDANKADGSGGARWMSVDAARDTLTFNQFDPSINAIGGYFFNTFYNEVDAGGEVRIVLTDTLGGVFQYLIETASATSFRGFTLSSGSIESITITAVNLQTFTRSNWMLAKWATVDNLVVGQVPAPFGLGVLLAGLVTLVLARCYRHGEGPAAVRR
jgi:hypothetical protein